MSNASFKARLLLATVPRVPIEPVPGARIAVRDGRVAPDVLARAIAGAWYWPEAAQVVDTHRAHLEVGLCAEIGSPIQRALALTRAIASLVARTEVLAVLWDATELLHHPAHWIAQAEDATPEDLPLLLWVAFEGRQNDDGTRSLRTRGVHALGSREVEVAASRRDGDELLETVCDVALYVLTTPVPLEDGDQIEVTRGRVRVRVQPSLRNDGTHAYRLRLP